MDKVFGIVMTSLIFFMLKVCSNYMGINIDFLLGALCAIVLRYIIVEG